MEIKDLGNNIRMYMAKFGMSVEELSKRSNISKTTIVNLRNGRGNPSYQTLKNIAICLNVKVKDLV